MARLHILGASGAGTTSLGAALADRLGHPHVDADSLFWLPTDPPFTTKRPKDDRQAMLLRLLRATGQWVFSGSAPQSFHADGRVQPQEDDEVVERLDRPGPFRPSTASASKRAATWLTAMSNF